MSDSKTIYIASHRHARISPRKVRLIADLIRGKNADDALNVLEFNIKRGGFFMKKVLKSALANAEVQNKDSSDLVVSKVTVDEGSTMKRWRPRAMGRATPIMKRMSHIHIELS